MNKHYIICLTTLFYSADYMAKHDNMITECGRKGQWPNVRGYPGFTKIRRKSAPSENEAGGLGTE
jgi:hypothetical protein